MVSKEKTRSFIAIKAATVLMLIGALAVALTGCAAGGSADDKVIKVGASPSPHAEILSQVKDALAKEGYTLEVTEYTDYVTPDEALANGDIDANYFQHLPYLQDFNSQHGTDLVSAGAVHFEPMGIYTSKGRTLAAVPNGAKIAVPSDATNEARALLLLQSQGIIVLKEGAGLAATKNDIAMNPYNVQLVETEAASVPRMLDDVDYAVINGNYVLSSGLDASKALASEAVDSDAAKTYANIIAVRSQDEDKPKIKALMAALQSDSVRSYISQTYKGTVVPVF